MRGELEVEQKFPLSDPALVEGRVIAQGAVFSALDQVDRYYGHPARDFAQTDEALRIRRVGAENCVTYKGPKLDAQTKTRREIEIPLPRGEEGFAQFASLLEALGFRRVAEVRKRRRCAPLDWQGFHVEVALDDVQGVGQFAELEIVSQPEHLAAAKAALATLAEHLGLKGSERRSYLEMLLVGGETGVRGQESGVRS